MAMAADEQPLHSYRRWGLPLESGTGHRLTPRANEPMYLTDVFLIDAKSAGGQGAVAACVQMGTRDLLLGLVSAEYPHVELQTPVLLDEEFHFYVMGPGDDASADADTEEDGTDAYADAAVVMFEGFLVTQRSNMEGDEAADDKDEEYEEYEEREETYGELDRYVARASSAGGISKDVRQVVAITIALLGFLLSVSMLVFLGLIK